MANRSELRYKDGNESYTFNSAAPINYSINNGKGVPGSYDGLILTPPDSKWKAFPANTNLNKKLSNPIFVSFNGGTPLARETVPMDLSTDMFLFARNKSSPFCMSNYSTDMGQVCTTKEQRDLIGQYRGNNARYTVADNPQF